MSPISKVAVRRKRAAAAGPQASAVPVWVFGASGMLAGELLRLLGQHPALRVAGAASREACAPLRRLHPQLPLADSTLDAGAAAEAVAARLREGAAAAVVLALPHGESAAAWLRLEAALGAGAGDLYVADLSADFRLRDPERYAVAYGAPHPAPALLGTFAYGLPEWNRDRIAAARRVAAPGCFATALQLATLPAAASGLLDPVRPWIYHAVTGSSGSGAAPSATTHHPHRHGNLWAYALDGHRHEAELAQALDELGLRPPVHFVPHSGPFARGIHLTASLPLSRPLSTRWAHATYAAAYDGAPFVEVLSDEVPDLRRVAGSNRASLAVHVRGDVLVVLCALDNLVKGGAGQAIQCLNLMLGLPEAAGLPRAGLGVC